MAREITEASKNESLKSEGVRTFVLSKLEFDSGTVTVWNGRGDLAWNGDTYTGLGDLGKISGLEEGIEQRAFGITMELAGIPPSSLSIALSEELQGRAAQVWVGFFDSAYKIVADPMLAFRGRMDTIDILMGKTATLILAAESRLRDWGKARVRRFTNADQQLRFPGDVGLEFISDTTEKEIVWGAEVVGGQGGGPVAAANSNPSASTNTVSGAAADGGDAGNGPSPGGGFSGGDTGGGQSTEGANASGSEGRA